jgi:hypothetical protein
MRDSGFEPSTSYVPLLNPAWPQEEIGEDLLAGAAELIDLATAAVRDRIKTGGLIPGAGELEGWIKKAERWKFDCERLEEGSL